MNSTRKLEAPPGYNITRGRATSNVNKRRIGLGPQAKYTVTPTRRSSTGVAPPYNVVTYLPPVHRWNGNPLPYNAKVLNRYVNAYGKPIHTITNFPKTNNAKTNNSKGWFSTMKNKVTGFFSKGGKRTRRHRRR